MPSPRKKKNSDQKKKTRGAAQRAKRDLNFIKLNEEAAALDDLWHAVSAWKRCGRLWLEPGDRQIMLW